ncbi:DUF2326 domain-containing protein [Ruminococcaceae bacterium OttesenSCG-928-A16]|nr:DUF2326 domain-containing protein [Ruminococcaceae bacterium OttesenSCG-928-A16]
MLTEICCTAFGDTTPVHFYEGLNIIQGLESNSIGKTSMLKVIDFAFGGTHYTSTSKDIFDNVGHHDVCFRFSFDHVDYFFKRNTKNPNTISYCNEKYETLNEKKVVEFNTFLKRNYQLDNLDLSFREVVSLFSRVWNKANKEVNRPLYLHSNQSVQDSILNLIKLFDHYEPISSLQKDNKYIDNKAKALKSAANFHIISYPTTKGQYSKNEIRIKEIDDTVVQLVKQFNIDFQNDKLNVTNMSEQLLFDRNNILQQKAKLSREMLRIIKNLEHKQHVDSSAFSQLKEFFPTVNVERLAAIQGFHQKISDIMTSELKSEKAKLERRLAIFDKQLSALDKEIEQLLGTPAQASDAITRILSLLSEKDQLNNMNKYYREREDGKAKKKKNKETLHKELESITATIESQLNAKISEFSKTIEGNNNKAPTLRLEAQTYDYGVPDNTGTGKAYTDLILFDLAMLSLTQLPILIHDSFLFNNISTSTIGSFLRIYNQFVGKQIFISLDKYYTFDDELDSILLNSTRKVLTDEKLLYGKDWRN